MVQVTFVVASSDRVLRHTIDVGAEWLECDPDAAWAWLWATFTAWRSRVGIGSAA
jgi:hypothetical protein